MKSKDAQESGMSRSFAERLFSNEPPEAVLIKGRVTLEVREPNLPAEKLEQIVNTVDRLSQQDSVDRDISVIVRKLSKSENPNGGTLAYTNVGGDFIVIGTDVFKKQAVQGLMPSANFSDLLDYVVTHEWGHVRAQEDHKHGDISTEGLSRYGKTNGNEAYAEAYAEWIVTGGKTVIKNVQELAVRFKWPKP
jgi:hypothetical protein